MQITEVDAKQELQVLAALVYNDQVLAASAPLIERESFQSPFSYSIARRCAKYHKKYGKSPRLLINDYIETEIENSGRKEEVKTLQTILDSLANLKLSVSGKRCNNKFQIDRATKYLENTRLGFLLEAAREAYVEGESDKVLSAVSKLTRASLGGTGHTVVDPWSDKHQLEQAFDDGEENILLKYIGPLGLFFGGQLARDNFIALQGPEKSFKSFWLQEFIHKGLKNRLRIFFIGIGDMSQKQYNRRIYSRIAYRPWFKDEYWYPTGWKAKSGVYTLPKRVKRKVPKHITEKEIQRALNKFNEKYLQTDKLSKYLKMMTVGEISILDIETQIKRYQDIEGWTPDIVITDYADRISPPKGVYDKIAAIDHNWNHLRALSLDHHCLNITGTQVRRSGYKGFLQTRDDVADSKTKTAVVTGLIGINFFPEEYAANTRRLNWIVCREHTKRSVVSVAACPAISHPCVLSV